MLLLYCTSNVKDWNGAAHLERGHIKFDFKSKLRDEYEEFFSFPVIKIRSYLSRLPYDVIIGTK